MKDSSEVVNQDNENSTPCEGHEVKGERRWRLLCELLQEFAHNSTLHGLRYLTARGLSALERIFWGIIFLASVCLCIMATTKVWVKWQTSPIIISVNEQLSSVMEVPFPAVTICPMTKVNQKYYNFTKHYIKFKKFIKELENENVTVSAKQKKTIAFIDQTPFMRELVNILNLVCQIDVYNFSPYKRIYLDHSSVMHMLKAAPSIKDIFIYGEWQQMPMDFGSDYFAPVLTKEGLCFAFNTLAANEMLHLQRMHKNYSYLNASIPRRGWSPENQYYSSNPDPYPRRGRSKSGFHYLIFGEDVNQCDICQGMFSGYKVYLHHPADLPQSSSNFYAVQFGEYAIFSVKVNLVSTSDSLINYAPHIRQCYFPSERELHYFKVYTQSNCQLECLTNYTLARCGCVEFHMPRNHSTFMCVTGHEVKCLYSASVEYSTGDDGFGNSNESLCQCLPLCHNVQYEADITLVRTGKDEAHSKIWRLVTNEINNKSKPDEENTWISATIDMNFKDAQFTSLRRSELFGATDFLANCGGLLGLFLGFSFLSLIELFYFATLRLGCMFTRHNRAEKKEKAVCNTSNHSKF